MTIFSIDRFVAAFKKRPFAIQFFVIQRTTAFFSVVKQIILYFNAYKLKFERVLTELLNFMYLLRIMIIGLNESGVKMIVCTLL